MWDALSDEITCVSFTIVAGPRQRSHSRVRVPRNSCSYFSVSDSRLLQPGGPGPQAASYDPKGYGGGIRARLHAGNILVLPSFLLRKGY
jgi:hypothetical protein